MLFIDNLLQWTEEHLVLMLCVLCILIWVDWVLIYLFWTGQIKRSRIPAPFFSWDAWKDELCREFANLELILSTIFAPIKPLLLCIAVVGVFCGAIITCVFIVASGLWIILIVPTKIWVVWWMLQ